MPWIPDSRSKPQGLRSCPAALGWATSARRSTSQEGLVGAEEHMTLRHLFHLIRAGPVEPSTTARYQYWRTSILIILARHAVSRRARQRCSASRHRCRRRSGATGQGKVAHAHGTAGGDDEPGRPGRHEVTATIRPGLGAAGASGQARRPSGHGEHPRLIPTMASVLLRLAQRQGLPADSKPSIRMRFCSRMSITCSCLSGPRVEISVVR